MDMDDCISRSGHIGHCSVILSMKLIPILLLMSALALGGACSSKRMATGNNHETLSTPTLDLLTAIDKENISIIKQHIDAGTNINDYPIPEGLPFEGAQPLHLAVLKGNSEIVNMLLGNGAQIDLVAKNKDKATPLHWAVFFQKKGMVSLLIESGANINSLDVHGFTPTDAGNLVKLSVLNKPKQLELVKYILTVLSKNGGVSASEL